MINHQSPYGQIIKIPSNMYYELSDDSLKAIEEKYACYNRNVINFSQSFESEEEYLGLSEIPDIIREFTDYEE